MTAVGQHAPKTGLIPHRHHQPHDPGAPGLPERDETPDPVRSDVVEPGFHDVRQAPAGDLGSGLLLEYRDLALAVGGEGGAVPALPAIPEPEARDPGHEV